MHAYIVNGIALGQMGRLSFEMMETLTAEGMFDKEKSSKEKKKNTRARAHFIYALVCERRFGPGHTKTTHFLSLLSTCWVMMMDYPMMDHVRHDMRYLLITSMVALIAFQFSYDSLFSLSGRGGKKTPPVYKTCSPSGAWIDPFFFTPPPPHLLDVMETHYDTQGKTSR